MRWLKQRRQRNTEAVAQEIARLVAVLPRILFELDGKPIDPRPPH